MRDRIKKLRKALDLTQSDFAARIGSTQNNIANYETGRRSPSAAALNNICKEFIWKMNNLRRSMMYVPGNKPGLLRDCMIYGADSIMFDLEDSVSLDQKDAARNLVYHALTTLDLSEVETVVRINDLHGPYGLKDIEVIVKAKPDIIRLPKTETAKDI